MPGRIFNQERFAERLSDIMKNSGDTIYTLADYLHLTPSSISKYTNANMVPKQITIDAMASKYNVNPVWLMGADVDKYLDEGPKYKEIPIFSVITAGQSVYAEKNIEGYESIRVDSEIDFCLKVKGDSMINARIYDGDIAFIKQQSDVENGEIVAVIIDEEEATLKRFYRYGSKIVLRPENPKHEEFEFNKESRKQIKILGKCTSVKFFI